MDKIFDCLTPLSGTSKTLTFMMGAALGSDFTIAFTKQSIINANIQF